MRVKAFGLQTLGGKNKSVFKNSGLKRQTYLQKIDRAVKGYTVPSAKVPKQLLRLV